MKAWLKAAAIALLAGLPWVLLAAGLMWAFDQH